MADWSELPVELLELIREHIELPFNLLRFRSVCSSWRSSVPFRDHLLPSKFPVLSNDSPSHDWNLSLFKRTLFLVNPPPTLSISNPRPWLLKLQETASGTMELCFPLSRYPIRSLPLDFSKLLNIYDLPIVELGQEYVLNDFSSGSINPLDDTTSLYMEKVVFTWLNSKFEESVLLTIHISGKLALFKSGDQDWTIIPHMPSPYDDVCVFQGKLYAVDNTGWTVEVGLDSSVSMVAEPVFGGDKKFLVESDGELLLLDMHLSFDYQCPDICDAFGNEVYGFGWEKAVRFDVYKLNEEENDWLELKSLGDRVLFLGDDCAFSASASDLSMSKGNCIVFRDDFFNNIFCENGVGIFHLDDDRVSPLFDCPEFSKLFWPPPDWIRLLRA